MTDLRRISETIVSVSKLIEEYPYRADLPQLLDYLIDKAEPLRRRDQAIKDAQLTIKDKVA